MSKQSKVAVALATVVALFFGGAIAYQVVSSPGPVDDAARANLVVRPDSHRLDTAQDGKVTLVEFLDFECEACASAYPFVEKLRGTYAGKVTFVVRYFPLPSHKNSRNAAHAVESAARQGKFEAMYARMYETQAQWGERQDSQAALFRTFAQDAGLDMARYDSDVDSPEVAARVQKDVDDATELGVSGTPTFYLNGKRLVPSTTEEFTQAIDKALAG